MSSELEIEDYISLVPETKLSIEFPFEHRLESKILDTVHQAVDFNVKELILNLNNNGDIGSSSFFPLPSFLNKNSDLERLNLSMCSFDSLQEIKWDSLKVLKISYTCLENSCIENIVFGCRVLKVLELCNCWGFTQLNFDDLTKLKKFVLDGIRPKVVEERAETDSLSISGASVEVLEILGNLDHNDLVLGDLNNCIEAKIAYFLTAEEDRRHRPLTMQPVFNSLKNVRTLTCGTWIVEDASDKFEAEFPYALGKCDCLTIHAPVEYRHQLGIMRFIESCPNVETLIIKEASCSRTNLQCDEKSDPSIQINSEADEIRSLKFSSGFPFKALKMIFCDEGMDSSSLPPFLKYLVNNTSRPVGKMSYDIRLRTLNFVFGC